MTQEYSIRPGFIAVPAQVAAKRAHVIGELRALVRDADTILRNYGESPADPEDAKDKETVISMRQTYISAIDLLEGV